MQSLGTRRQEIYVFLGYSFRKIYDLHSPNDNLQESEELMKYLVNFEIVKQGFSEIVEATDKEQALEKAKQYLEKRFLDLKSNDTITEIHEGRN